MYDQINTAIGYLHGLWRYRWSALLISWIVFVVGCLAVYSLPDQYESKATVNIDTTTIMRPLLQGLAVETDRGSELTLMTQVLLSRDNLQHVIRETGMAEGIDSPEEIERLTRDLANQIQITSRSQMSHRGAPFAATYQIVYRTLSPDHAYKVVAELVNTMQESYQNTDSTDTTMAQSFLDKQILDYEKKLEQDERRLAEFKKQNIDFMPGESGSYFERLRASQLEIDNIRTRLREAKQRYAQLRTQLSMQSPMLSSGGGGTAPVNPMLQYKEQLAELLTRFTENHPDVQALRAKIASLEAERSSRGTDESGAAVEYNPVYQELKVQQSAARVEVGRLQIRLAEEQKKLQEYEQSIDVIPQVEADLAKLNRDYEITKDRYLSLVERRESARLAQDLGQSNTSIAFKMVEPPVVPVLPAGPNRFLFLAGVIMASLVAGAGWSLLRFLLFPGFVDSKQVKEILNLPILGSVTYHFGTEQIRGRRLALTNYFLVVALLMITFLSALLFAQQGSEYISSLLK